MSNYKLSPIGKLFFASIVGWIFGKKLNMKLRGNPKDLQAVADAVIASKKFQEELKRPGATVQSVIDKLHLKNLTAKKFKELTGKDFPL